jgi:hypothetical protein
VPRRRTGKKATAALPAGYVPDISVLLRDAAPIGAEIASAAELPDRQRREVCRRRELAIENLIKMYQDAKKHEQLDQLEPRVRLFCEQLKERHGGELPKPKGGRPSSEHRSVLIAVHTQEAIERLGDGWGSKERAFREIVERDGVSYYHVKAVYQRAFGRTRDPDFRQAVDFALRERQLDRKG